MKRTEDADPEPRFRRVVWPGGRDESLVLAAAEPSLEARRYQAFFEPLIAELLQSGFAGRSLQHFDHTGRFLRSRLDPGIGYAASFWRGVAWVGLHIRMDDTAHTQARLRRAAGRPGEYRGRPSRAGRVGVVLAAARRLHVLQHQPPPRQRDPQAAGPPPRDARVDARHAAEASRCPRPATRSHHRGPARGGLRVGRWRGGRLWRQRLVALPSTRRARPPRLSCRRRIPPGDRSHPPAACASRPVAVCLGGTMLTGHAEGREIARHERSPRAGTEILVLDHYLEVLARKPGALPQTSHLWLARRSRGGHGTLIGVVSRIGGVARPLRAPPEHRKPRRRDSDSPARAPFDTTRACSGRVMQRESH